MEKTRQSFEKSKCIDCKNSEIRQPRRIDHEEDIQHKQ